MPLLHVTLNEWLQPLYIAHFLISTKVVNWQLYLVVAWLMARETEFYPVIVLTGVLILTNAILIRAWCVLSLELAVVYFLGKMPVVISGTVFMRMHPYWFQGQFSWEYILPVSGVSHWSVWRVQHGWLLADQPLSSNGSLPELVCVSVCMSAFGWHIFDVHLKFHIPNLLLAFAFNYASK